MADLRYPKPRPAIDSSRLILTEFPRPDSWTESAACSQYPADIWYPSEKGASVAHAKMICGGCDVQTECLAYAVTNSEDHGIWGGLEPAERRRVRRRGAA